MPSDEVASALNAVKRRKGRLLAPDVVEAAKDPDSPLHDQFEWDDSKAAHAHRVWQARRLIVSVGLIEDGDREPVQLYYSLSSDRASGGGYRDIRDIVSDDELREELLRDAASDAARFKEKFQRIKHDLAEMFDAIDRLQSRVNGKARKNARLVAAGAN